MSESFEASYRLFTMCAAQLEEPWLNIAVLLLIILGNTKQNKTKMLLTTLGI